MNNICKYLFIKIFRKIKNYRVRIYNKKFYYEIYITHLSPINEVVKNEISNIYIINSIENYMFGHGNIIFSIKDRENIYKIIKYTIDILIKNNIK